MVDILIIDRHTYTQPLLSSIASEGVNGSYSFIAKVVLLKDKMK